MPRPLRGVFRNRLSRALRRRNHGTDSIGVRFRIETGPEKANSYQFRSVMASLRVSRWTWTEGDYSSKVTECPALPRTVRNVTAPVQQETFR
jgi:hypothetical protein